MLCRQTTGLIATLLALLLGTACWAQSHRQATTPMRIEGIAVPPNLRARPDATPAPGMTLHLTFALTPTHKADIEAFIASQHDPKSPNFQRWLTPQQFGQKFGASDADLQTVVNYAQAQGFRVTQVWPNRLFVSAETTVAQAERVFRVHIGGYERTAAMMGKGDPPTFYAPDTNPLVPAVIANRVQGIFGLSNQLRAHSHIVHGPKSAAPLPQALGAAIPYVSSGPPAGPLGPPDLSRIYNFDALHNAGLKGQGMTIGIFSPTLVDLSDILNFAAYYGLPVTANSIIERQVDGGATDPFGQDEADLDMEVIFGQAPAATVVLYEAPVDLAFSTLDLWNQIVADNLPVLSNSWGPQETDTTQAYADSEDVLLAEMETQGQAHYNASGDSGAFDRATLSQLTVVFPGSSTHVTSVGGTSLPNATWQGEIAWTYSASTGGGSGGGLSVFFDKASWQTGPGVINGFSNGKRQTPDIAALADPGVPGYAILTGGVWQPVGGTSGSTPLWAAGNLLIDQGAGTRLGLLNQDLYNIGTNLNAKTDIFVYHDVTVGNNGHYPCTSFWDFVTGWGSANFYKLYLDLLPMHQIDIPALRPNLHPTTPPGTDTANGVWTAPLMIHTTPKNVTEPATFNNSTLYYFAAAIANDGPADVRSIAHSIQIDGVDHPFNLGPFAAGQYTTASSVASNGIGGPVVFSTELTPGTHTIKLIVNPGGTVHESNLNDNVYTRTINVQANPLPNLVGLTLKPAAVVGGSGTSTATISLDSPAPAGGITINIASSNPQVAAVPSATINVPETARQVSFDITTSLVSADTNVTISATYNGQTQSAPLDVRALVIAGLKLNPTTVTGGSSSTGTITLNGPAPQSGVTINLTNSNSQAATVPATVAIAGNSNQATFTISTNVLAADTTAVITAAYNGRQQPATLTIRALLPLLLRINPSSVTGGSSTTGTITLNGPAPANGAVVTLASSDTSVATVPATVTVPNGATSATFTVSTNVLPNNATVTISATYNGRSPSAPLSVRALTPVILTLNPLSVTGGSPSTGTITLNGPAPANGAVVTLASSGTSVATVPATVTIPGGATSTTFTVTTNLVSTSTSVTITATFNGVSRIATLGVRPLTFFSITLSPNFVTGGSPSTGTITLSGPAPQNGAVITLASSNTSVATVPATVTVPVGTTSATFTVNTVPIATNVSVTITGTYGGATRIAPLFVRALTLTSLTLSPNFVTGGTTSTGTVTLSGPAPTGGLTVTLGSGNRAATVPASVTVAANATTATFTVNTSLVSTTTFVPISATYGSTTRTTPLIIRPLPFTSLSITPFFVTGGSTATGTVTLGGAAPTGGLTIALTSSNTNAATVPASVTIAAGSTSATFTVTTNLVSSPTLVSISGTYGGMTRAASLFITPLNFTSLTISPVYVVAGSTATGTVTLNGPAPTGGLTIALASGNPSIASVPSSVTIAAGSTSATFTVNTALVAALTTVRITGTYNSTVRAASLTVQPLTLTGLSLSTNLVTGGSTVTGTVTLNGPAPTGGVVVALSSSDPAASVPAGVMVAGGSNSATFTITANPVPTNTGVTITASYGGISRTARLVVQAPILAGLDIVPDVVYGGDSTTGTVTLNGPAPAGGVVIGLTISDSTVATVPTSVTVPPGATSADFEIDTLPSGAFLNFAVVTANYRGGPYYAELIVIY